MGFRFVAATLSLSLLPACTGSSAPAPQATGGKRPPTSVLVEPVKAETIQRSVPLLGTLYGDEEASISNKVAGRVRRIAADVGDVVSSEATLCELEDEDFVLAVTASRRSLEAVLARLGVSKIPDGHFDADRVASVARALAEQDNAKAKHKRLVGLREQDPKFVSEQALQDAETSVTVGAANVEAERVAAQALVAQSHQQKAELELAERRLAEARIASPAGKHRWSIAARYVSEGEYLREGTPLFRVVAPDPLKLRAAVPERYAGEFKVGLEARVRVEAYDQVFPGRVSRINPSVDASNRTFGLEIVVPNAEGKLLPGIFAHADVLTRMDQALLVPLESIVSFAGVTKVFYFENGLARSREVVPGLRHGNWIEAVGVEAGKQILTRGQTVVADGSPVAIAAPSSSSTGETKK